MVDTRLVIANSAANTGGSRVTVADNTITFETPIRGPYTTSNFIMNISLGTVKAITGVTNMGAGWHADMIVSVDVADATGWTSAHTYVTLLTNQPTFIYATLIAALTAASNDDEVRIWPADEKGRSGPFLLQDPGTAIARTGILIAGYSTLKKINYFMDDMAYSTGGATEYTWQDINFHFGDQGMNYGTSLDYTFIFKRCRLTGSPNSPTAALIFVNGGNAGSTTRLINCEFNGVLRDGIQVRNINHDVTADFCTFIGCGTGFFLINTAGADAGLARNCVAIWCNTAFAISAAPATWHADTAFNAAHDGTAPGSDVVSNDFDSTDLAMVYDRAPDLVSAGFPYDFRDIDGEGSLVEDAGTPLAGVTDDIDGRIRDVTNPNIGCTEGFTGFAGAASGGGGTKTRYIPIPRGRR